jgi:uncharacterized protein YfdQ (DUF2303 family)
MPVTELREAAGSPRDAQAIIDAMRSLHGVAVLTVGAGDAAQDAQHVLAVPKGVEIKSIKPLLDEYLTKPERRRGIATLTTLNSFVQHTNRFKDADSIIYAQRDEQKPGLISVLDYHMQGPNNEDARFGQHRGRYAFPVSEQWEAWAKIDGVKLGQKEFAEFLEERIMDILPPPLDGRADAGALALDLVSTLGGEMAGPSRLLEVARGLKMQEMSEVTNAQNLQSGEMELVFRTTHTDGQGNKLNVPSLFLIGVPVFDGDAAYKLPIRLQYRRSGPAITWIIKRYRPEIVFFDAFDQATKKVEAETQLPVLIGTPEA